MVNANELRIGNRVSHNGKFLMVTKIDSAINNEALCCLDKDNSIDDFYMMSFSDDGDLQPIPLTPEILSKCGFRQTDSDYNFWNDEIGSLSESSGGGYYLDDTESGSVNKKPIFYLHQLQNLYFALTGTELEIKL